MNLSDMLALRPKGTDAASFRDAVTRAEDAQRQAASTVAQLTRKAASSLLTADDAEMMQTEQDLAEARRSVERLSMLIPELQTGHADAEARETRDVRSVLVSNAVTADAAFIAMWEKHFVPLAEKAALVLRAKREADTAIDSAAPMIDLPRHEAFPTRPHPGQPDPLALVLTLAALAPTEIKWAAEAEAIRSAAYDAKQAAARAEVEARAAEGRTQMAREDAEWCRQQDAEKEPSGYARAPIRILAG